MVNQLNSDLVDIRVLLEHYNKILDIDKGIKDGELEGDGRPLLSDEDIADIKKKIDALVEKRDDLLSNIDDYVEIS